MANVYFNVDQAVRMSKGNPGAAMALGQLAEVLATKTINWSD